MTSKVSNILIIKPGAIGDLLHLTPAIRVLKEKFPQARISILVGSRMTASLFENNPLVHDTIIYDKRGEHRSISALLRLRKVLHDRCFDLVINYQRSNLKGWFLASAAFPCRVLIYHKARKRGIHAVVNHLETLVPLGIDPLTVDYSLVFNPGGNAERYADRLFEDSGFLGKIVVAFNPGTSHLCKCWPTDRFALLGDRLVEEADARVIILGSRDEKVLAKEISSGMRHSPLDLTGCTLGELGAILERVPVLVTGDTGPMHISSAVGTPVVALYGAISPERSAPLGARHRIVMHRELLCCPCNSFKCRNKVFRECMEMITVDEVFSAIMETLADQKISKGRNNE